MRTARTALAMVALAALTAPVIAPAKLSSASAAGTFPPCVETPSAPISLLVYYYTSEDGMEEALPGAQFDMRGSNCSDYPGSTVPDGLAPGDNRVDARAFDGERVNLDFAQVPRLIPTNGALTGLIWVRLNVANSQGAIDYLAERGLKLLSVAGAAAYQPGPGTTRIYAYSGQVGPDAQDRVYWSRTAVKVFLRAVPLTASSPTDPPAPTSPPGTTIAAKGSKVAVSSLVQVPAGFRVTSVTVAPGSKRVCRAVGLRISMRNTGVCAMAVTVRKGRRSLATVVTILVR